MPHVEGAYAAVTKSCDLETEVRTLWHCRNWAQCSGGRKSAGDALGPPLHRRQGFGHRGERALCGEELPAGEIVLRLSGRLVSTDELARLIEHANADPSHAYVDTLTIYEDTHLVLPSGSVIHFGNHSCDPNMWHRGPFEIATRRAVDAGEELTIDYGTQSGAAGFSMACSCGSALCRGAVSSDDWRCLLCRRATRIIGFRPSKLGLPLVEIAPVARTVARASSLSTLWLSPHRPHRWSSAGKRELTRDLESVASVVGDVGFLR